MLRYLVSRKFKAHILLVHNRDNTLEIHAHWFKNHYMIFGIQEDLKFIYCVADNRDNTIAIHWFKNHDMILGIQNDLKFIYCLDDNRDNTIE